MKTNSNRGSAEAQEVQQQSEFIKRIGDFAKFMEKEYIEESDDELALLICSMDRTLGDDKVASGHIALGGRATMTAAVASMLRNEEIAEVFRVASKVSGRQEDRHEDATPLRRRLRMFYGLAGVSAGWTLALVFMLLSGMLDWMMAVSNLVLMTFTGLELWCAIRDQRRRLKRIEESEKREFRDRLDCTMGLLTAVLKDIAGRMKNDDDE